MRKPVRHEAAGVLSDGRFGFADADARRLIANNPRPNHWIMSAEVRRHLQGLINVAFRAVFPRRGHLLLIETERDVRAFSTEDRLLRVPVAERVRTEIRGQQVWMVRKCLPQDG